MITLIKDIEDYVEAIYKGLSNTPTLTESKEEMKNHLYESVKDLITEGNTKEEAIKISIQRFGERKQISKGLFTLFNKQKLYAKWLIIAIGVVFLLSIVSLILLIFIYHSEKKDLDHLSTVISKGINNNKTLTDSEVEKINHHIKMFNNKYHDIKILALIYDEKGITNDGLLGQSETKYMYPSIANKFGNYYSLRQIKDNWYMQYETENRINNLYFIPATGFILLFLLSVVWLCIDLKYRKRNKNNNN